VQTSAAADTEKGKGDDGKGKKKEPSVEDPNVPWEEMDVGIVVKVKGRVGRNWMGVMQVEVIKVEVLGCTDMEVRCWNEVMAFRRDVLGRPWVVEKEEEEKCLRRRERELRHLRKEGKSKKGKGESGLEKDEVRRKRKELERKERHDEEVKRQKQKEIQHEEETNRRFNASNKKNYPSLAVRRAAAGK